jgi:hypothetical protein
MTDVAFDLANGCRDGEPLLWLERVVKKQR